MVVVCKLCMLMELTYLGIQQYDQLRAKSGQPNLHMVSEQLKLTLEDELIRNLTMWSSESLIRST